ncbi:MAG: TetR/AcrR family transcriptional regulator [Blastochloris sp.]|nr:TetR/AcrR family transcriptional regulator [Blastochloris sp.]
MKMSLLGEGSMKISISPLDADTRDALLNATLRCVAEKGYDNVTIDDIAAATGNTKGAVYHYFSGKKQLYHAALEQLTEQLGQSGALFGLGQPFEAAALSLLKEVAGLGTSDWDTDLPLHDIYYLYFDGLRRFPQLKAMLATQRQNYVNKAVEQVKGSFDPPLEDAQARHLALQLLVGIEGVALLHATSGGCVTEDDLKTMVKTWVEGLEKLNV